MKPFKEYNKETLKQIIDKCSSMREVGRTLGISNQNAKSIVIRYNINYAHFKHGRAYNELIDNKYHMLIVKSLYKKGRRTYAKCICDCGKEKSFRADGVKSGRIISCGCHSKDRWNMVGGKNPYFRGVGELRQTKYSEIKRQALNRHKKFDVSIEYLWNLYVKQNKKCALTGLSIIFGRNGHRNETSASLDRIDNNQGYIEGNVRWVLKDINMIRGSYDTDYFIELCKAVAGNH